MQRFKLLIENFLVYGFGGAISRIIPFVMLPVITRLLPDTRYMGLSDNVVVLVSFGTAIAVMGMYDAMFRMFFEKEGILFQKQICSSALFFVTIGALSISLLLFIFRRQAAFFFFASSEYVYLVNIAAITIFVTATSNILSAPTRMQNQRKIYLLTNSIAPIVAYGVSFLMLSGKKYSIALPIGSLLSAVLLEIIFIILNRQWFEFKLCKREYIVTMLKIALPLLPGALIYWIFNSADRIMITNILGADHTGIYAVGAKIGHISNLIYMAFAGGWQFFSFSTMKDSDQVELTTNILEYLSVITFSSGILMTIIYKKLFSLLFTGDYLQGAITVPYLFLAPLLLMLYQVAANQFLVIKKTLPSTIVLFCGAIVNIALNNSLIPVIGVEGAAVGTMAGYIITVWICLIVLQKMRLLNLGSRFVLSNIGFFIYFIIWRLFFSNSFYMSLVTGTFCFLFFLCLYFRKTKELLHKRR